MNGATETVPWWMAGSLFAAWAVRELWGALRERRKVSTETDANVELLTGLVERVKMLETSQLQLTARLDEEMKLRMTAQEESHRLRLRVLSLESALRQLGAVVPQEPGT